MPRHKSDAGLEEKIGFSVLLDFLLRKICHQSVDLPPLFVVGHPLRENKMYVCFFLPSSQHSKLRKVIFSNVKIKYLAFIKY